jgi:hypothetical protein
MQADDFNSYVTEIVEQWTRQLEQKLLSAMMAEGLVDTGKLQQSLRAKVFGAVNNATCEMQLSFNSYGRVLDMQRSGHVPTHTNAHSRAVLGAGRTLRNRERTWYNRVWYCEKNTLIPTLMGDVMKLTHKNFLNWLTK